MCEKSWPWYAKAIKNTVNELKFGDLERWRNGETLKWKWRNKGKVAGGGVRGKKERDVRKGETNRMREVTKYSVAYTLELSEFVFTIVRQMRSEMRCTCVVQSSHTAPRCFRQQTTNGYTHLMDTIDELNTTHSMQTPNGMEWKWHTPFYMSWALDFRRRYGVSVSAWFRFVCLCSVFTVQSIANAKWSSVDIFSLRARQHKSNNIFEMRCVRCSCARLCAHCAVCSVHAKTGECRKVKKEKCLFGFSSYYCWQIVSNNSFVACARRA